MQVDVQYAIPSIYNMQYTVESSPVPCPLISE